MTHDFCITICTLRIWNLGLYIYVWERHNLSVIEHYMYMKWDCSIIYAVIISDYVVLILFV
jgi:hypothetical protein